MVWPSFWGWKNGENIFPMKKDSYELIVKKVLSTVSFKKNNSWPIINENIILNILTSFESQTSESTPVYVSGGKVYARNSNGLSTSYHPITDPYTWPIGHNVRPATMY